MMTAEQCEDKANDILEELDGNGEFERVELESVFKVKKGFKFKTTVEITGDWRHAHGACDEAFQKAGFKLDKITGKSSNTSDWYKACHHYSIPCAD